MQRSNRTCFVIMPFSDPEGYEQGHFKKIYEQIFKPAIEFAGFQALRCDEITNACSQYSNMFEHLDNDPLVLCDISTYNPNVLYELGLRHYSNKPSVIVQEEGQKHLFDLRQFNIISYRKNRLYDEVLADQQRIAKALIESTPNNHIDSVTDTLPNAKPVLRGIREANVRGYFKNYAPSYPSETYIPQLESQAWNILQKILNDRRFITDELIPEPSHPKKHELLEQYLDQLKFGLEYSKFSYRTDDAYVNCENLYYRIKAVLDHYLASQDE
jgi:hypothetical protein